MSRIKYVLPKEDYRLEVQLENGSTITLNMKSKLGTARFGILSDKSFFDCATTDGNFIRWTNKVEISVSEIFEWVQKR